MPRCARCGNRFAAGSEWIHVEHNHPHMRFESDFCSTSCAAAYLEDGIDSPSGR